MTTNKNTPAIINVIIVLMALFIVFILFLSFNNKAKTLKLSKRALYYPQNIEFYYESSKYASTTTKEYILGISKSYIKDFPCSELLAKSDNYSIGFWNKNFIIVINNNNKILSAPENNKNIKQYKYKSLNLTQSDKYSFIKDKKYIILANSPEILNFAIGNKDQNINLYTMDLTYGLELLDKQRDATVIMTDFSTIFKHINKTIKQDIIVKKIAPLIKSTFTQLKRESNSIIVESHTFLDTSTLKNTIKQKAVLDILNKPSKKLDIEFIPQNSNFAVSIYNFQTFLNALIWAKNIDNNSNFKYFESTIKASTGLDFEKDIISLFDGDLTMLLLDTNDKKNTPLFVLNTKNSALKLFTRLINLIPSQVSSVNVSDYLYKNVELQEISLEDSAQKNSGFSLCWGEINPNLLIVGDKNAIKTFINNINANKTIKYDTDLSQEEKIHIYFNNNNKSSICNRVDASIKTLNDHIKSTVRFYLRGKNGTTAKTGAG